MDEMIRDAANLVVFATVVRCGSISHGAERLGLERTTVSRRIRDFETRLGKKLLHRSNRRVTVTDAGRRCYLHSLRVIKAAEDASAAVQGSEYDLPLVVGASSDLVESLFADVAAGMRQEFPSARIEFEIVDDCAAVEDGTVDLAVLSGIQPTTNACINLRHLGAAEQLIVASPAYEQEVRRAQSIDDVQDLRWIGCTSATNVTTLFRRCARDREILIIPARQVSTASVAARDVAANHGICVLPRHVVWKALRAGELTAVLRDYSVPPLDLYLAHRRSREPGVVAEAFASSLAYHLQGGRPSSAELSAVPAV